MKMIIGTLLALGLTASVANAWCPYGTYHPTSVVVMPAPEPLPAAPVEPTPPVDPVPQK